MRNKLTFINNFRVDQQQYATKYNYDALLFLDYWITRELRIIQSYNKNTVGFFMQRKKKIVPLLLSIVETFKREQFYKKKTNLPQYVPLIFFRQAVTDLQLKPTDPIQPPSRALIRSTILYMLYCLIFLLHVKFPAIKF